MITAFEVGSIFRIVDQASPQLRAILKAASALDKATASIAKNLAAIGAAKLAVLSGEMRTITADAVALDKALGGSSRGMARFTKAAAGVPALTAQLAGAATAVQALAAGWTNVATQAAAASAAMRGASRPRLPPPGRPPALPPPLPGAGGGRGGRGGFHFGRFGASVPVLGGHVHASAPSTAAGVAVGAGLFSVYELGKYAMEPQHQEAMLRLQGLDSDAVAQVIARARATAEAVPGSGFSTNVKSIGEMYSVVGLEHALDLSEKMAQLDRTMALVGKGTEEGSGYLLTRAGELMGRLSDPSKLGEFENTLTTMSRVAIATHGKVTPAEWLNFAKQAGPASGNLTDEGLYTSAAVIQAMGGYRAGTAAQALQRQFAGGKMTKPVALELISLGLAKQDDFEFDHGRVIPHTDAMKELVGKMQRDPLSGIIDIIGPALESHGFTTPEAISREIYKFIGTGPAQREVYELLRGRTQIQQERQRAMQALTPGAATTEMNRSDPVQVMGALSTAFKDLLGAVGGPLAQAAIPGMAAMTNVFNRISAIANEYQKVTGVVGSIGAGAAAGGAAGFGVGWLGGPVGAGGGALIGAGAGAGYGLWNVLPESVRSGAKTGASWGMHVGAPGAVAGGIVGGMWGGLSGLWGSAANGSLAAIGKNILMVTPPPQKVDVTPSNVTINLDGRKVGEAVMAFMARQGQGPAQGAPAFDPTRGTTSFDFSLVN